MSIILRRRKTEDRRPEQESTELRAKGSGQNPSGWGWVKTISRYCVKHLKVTIAAGLHLFPFRTEKLSPSAPMVLLIAGE